VRDAFNGGVRVLLAPDGHAFTTRVPDGVRTTGRGAAHAPFAPDSTVAAVGDAVVAVDAAADTLWRYDPGADHFVPLELPDGDRFVQLRWLRLDREQAAELARLAGHEPVRFDVHYLLGERGAYVVRGGAAVAAPAALPREPAPRPARRPAVAVDPVDPLVFTVTLPAGPGPGFQHEFRPRTGAEWLNARTAMAWSLLRPPVLQVAGSFVPPPRRLAWLFDPLTSDGRRAWLVFASCLLGGLLAWRTARRLQHLGATRATVRGWTAAVVLFGAPAALVSIAVERRRAYSRPPLVAAPPPRIHTPELVEEAVP
jgi:hypothetical protein